ncbi:unnamed protein product [Soboliphyme baturini]|uniref:Thiamine diphosphokinase n=1 Tax=Soboliphyme baturini TaxID=241478 RepID=A0A183ISV2_9BILA|nr:unnamed protein product [Soboliphyme baturini]
MYSNLVRVAADGAADKLRELGNGCFIPDILCGDLDSVSASTVKFLRSSVILKIPDQDSTDFTKCLRTISNKIVENIVALGGLCGRFDHVIGCLNSLSINLEENPHLRLFLLHSESLVTLLPKGENHIHLDLELCTGKCGLAPLGFPVENVYTDGLKWNLSKSVYFDS